MARHPMIMQNAGREKLWRKFLAALRVLDPALDWDKFPPREEIRQRAMAAMEAQQ